MSAILIGSAAARCGSCLRRRVVCLARSIPTAVLENGGGEQWRTTGPRTQSSVLNTRLEVVLVLFLIVGDTGADRDRLLGLRRLGPTAELVLDLQREVRVVVQERLRVLATLADAHVAVGEEGTHL